MATNFARTLAGSKAWAFGKGARVLNVERDLERPIEPRAGAWRKLAAVIEVVGMLAVANAILWRLAPVLHIPDVGPLLQSAARGASVPQWYVSGILLLHLTLRGALFLALVFAVDLIKGRRDPDRYGLSFAGHSMGGLLVAGMLAACVAGLPLKCFALAVHFHLFSSSGGSEAYRFVNRGWGLAFWFLYILAMCVVVPFQEEFFFRGYAQRRLAQAFGAAGAIILGSLFFTLQHLVEYLYRLDVPNVAQLTCIALDAMVLGYLYWRTRSLLPCIIAHAAGNAPFRGFSAYLALTLVMVLVVMVYFRTCRQQARVFFRQVRTPDLATTLPNCND
jgi:membrane protease YdiL (CAAX protease family)